MAVQKSVHLALGKLIHLSINLSTLYRFEFAQFYFTLQKSETNSTSLEFAHSQILLHNPLYVNQLAQF